MKPIIVLIPWMCLMILTPLIINILVITNQSAAEAYLLVSTPAIAQLTTGTVTSTVIVTVTNCSDVVNGDTASIAALTGNPGPDGISFREALNASNNTLGPKAIEFASALAGSTITFASNGDVLLPSSGGLTIDGDINQDGMPDITLDGHLGQNGTPTGPGLSIVSSDNTISGLNFFDFASCAIQIACPDRACSPKLFANNKIVNNNISSPRGDGISISSLGLRFPEEAPLLSDVTWQDTLLSGNTIVIGGQSAIGVRPGVGGASRNQVISITISSNYISGGSVGIDISAADTASDYFGIPGPIAYSDNNVIDNMVISDNTIEDSRYFGISIMEANYGNRANQILNTKIISNTIASSMQGISVVTAAESGSQRSTSNNLLANIEVRHNIIRDVRWGILVGVTEKPGPHLGCGFTNNRMERVLIIDNSIHDYLLVGLRVWGGWSIVGTAGSADNTLDQLHILQNQITTTITRENPIGMEFLGGWSLAGPAIGNRLQGVTVSDNTVSGNNVGISLVGGRGVEAQENQVTIAEIQANTFSGNTEFIRITDNDQGATSNEVEMPTPYYRAYLPIVAW